MGETSSSRRGVGPATRIRNRVRRRPLHTRERGAFAIMSAPTILLILGMCALAIDLGLVYNRQVELHGLARTAALAAARELDGSADGITAAVASAGVAAGRLKYAYGVTVPWSADAIRFSDSPGTGAVWVSADEARANPRNRFYVRIDTSVLARELRTVGAIFARLLSSARTEIQLDDVAVAGRSEINVLPMALCAMSETPGAPRNASSGPQELVEYGFRRGVTYDLMQLNPNGATPVNFVVDPLTAPGKPGASANTDASTVSPFICTGKMWIPHVMGDQIRVSSPFPAADLYRQLNSRFDQYDGGVCDPNGAPPDFNIKAYVHGTSSGVPWMNPRPTHPGAAPHSQPARLQTIADPASPPGGTTAGMYGPLWAYARAVRYSAYQEGVPEPAAGYPSFAPADWSRLYVPAPTASGYPSRTPYFASFGANYSAPSASRLPLSVIGRRVLYVPLLSCSTPVPSGSNVGATVAAIGKFFMTFPATPTSVHAEFAGIADPSTITGTVILYQ